MRFSYRQPTQSDCPRLSVLFNQVYIDTYGLEGVSHEFTNFIAAKFSVEKLQRDIASDQYDFWIATYRDNLVGVILIEHTKACPIGDFVGPEVNKLYMLRRFFGTGVGQQLMECAETDLRAKGEKKVWLWAGAENARAIHFYKKMDYEWIGNAPFKMEVNTYNNVVMVKEL